MLRPCAERASSNAPSASRPAPTHRGACERSHAAALRARRSERAHLSGDLRLRRVHSPTAKCRIAEVTGAEHQRQLPVDRDTRRQIVVAARAEVVAWYEAWPRTTGRETYCSNVRRSSAFRPTALSRSAMSRAPAGDASPGSTVRSRLRQGHRDPASAAIGADRASRQAACGPAGGTARQLAASSAPAGPSEGCRSYARGRHAAHRRLQGGLACASWWSVAALLGWPRHWR